VYIIVVGKKEVCLVLKYKHKHMQFSPLAIAMLTRRFTPRLTSPERRGVC